MKIFLVLFVLIFCISCQNDLIYSENKPINTYGWKIDDTLIFKFKIEDIQSKYDLKMQIRHRDVYEFMNVYLQILTTMPNGEIKKDIVSMPLSDESGNWMGKCAGDICFQEMGLMRKIKFNQKGDYTLKINHEMRLDQLNNLLDIGIKLEKTKKKLGVDEA